MNALLFFQESDLASVIVGAIQVIFTAVAALIMDKAGRKVLLIISGTSSQQENKVQRVFNRCACSPFDPFLFCPLMRIISFLPVFRSVMS